MITLFMDGYVRLTPQELRIVRFVHLASNLDMVDPTMQSQGATLTQITGYTEWVSIATPVISMGWDWRLDHVGGKSSYFQRGAPRSNVMLVDDRRKDLGPAKTEALLEVVISELEWRTTTARTINSRYA